VAIDDLPIDRSPAEFRAPEVERGHLGAALEAGTPPEDRRFRPDIQGLRAIAVILVLFSHVHWNFFADGLIGVDIFFVISGYVITGVILREANRSDRIDVLSFYARRIRRIVPVALLVIVVTVILERLVFGSVAAFNASLYGEKAAVFVSNMPNVFAVTPHGAFTSPFGPYWSLSIEEQFYLVYPLIILSVLLIPISSLRLKLGIVLSAVVVASFWFSVVASPGLGTYTAYVSFAARAWELSLGCLLALCGSWLRRIPVGVGAFASWVGLGAILLASHYMPLWGGYPGYIAAWPAVATAVVIAGGTIAAGRGAEFVLKRSAFQAIGRWSYSIYLWHWPILVLVAQHFGPLSLPENLLLLVAAIAISAASYALVENPIRRSTYLSRSSWLTVGLGLFTIGIVVALLSAFT
jgi:peptidoglycan/LPS O-acetylase OafA/YrhL